MLFHCFSEKDSVAFFSLFLEIFFLCFKKQVHYPQSLNLVCLNAMGTSMNLSLTLLQRKISVRVAWTASCSIGKWGKSEVSLFLVGSLCLFTWLQSQLHAFQYTGRSLVPKQRKLWASKLNVSLGEHIWCVYADFSALPQLSNVTISIFYDSRNKLTRWLQYLLWKERPWSRFLEIHFCIKCDLNHDNIYVFLTLSWLMFTINEFPQLKFSSGIIHRPVGKHTRTLIQKWR